MDPLTAATTFSTIVSLIAEFRAQSHTETSNQFDEFTAWLAENRHDELLSLLQQNVKTSISIKALLATNTKVFDRKLEQLDRALAAIASTLEGFSELALAVRPEARLSAQAVSILKQFSVAGASRAFELKGLSLAHLTLLFTDGSQKEISFSEPQFIEDDLHSLIELGLLRLDYNSSGSRIFLFTRMAAALVSENADV